MIASTRDESAPLLEAEGVRISFGSGRGARRTLREVVHGVDLALQPGQVLALVGESGSGKSVLANSLLGLLPPNAEVSGSIRLDGAELLGASAEKLRAVRGGRIGSIFQEPMRAFNPLFTIGQQIREAIAVHLQHEATTARVIELLISTGLPEPERIARSFPHQLSGGQLQRAMIAMAVSCRPVALIADEPTTALDVTVQAEILDLLRQTSAESGAAVLLITHDMGVVADLADDVAVMRQGELVERAPVAALFSDPQHDYTKMLLSAVPRLGATRRPHPAEQPRASSTVVEISNLSVHYGQKDQAPALDRVSLKIGMGEVLGLVGESGSGKSTLGKVLAGLAQPSAGQVFFDGHPLNRRTLKSIRRELGIVFQDPASSLNPQHLLATSIAEPLQLHSKLNRVERSKRVAEILESVQLPASMANRYPHELSGGQRQRAALARALVLSPRLLIADEPTSALDVSVQARIIELLQELQQSHQFACLFISHDLAVVEQLADRVAVLRRGSLVEVGQTSDVLTQPHEEYTQLLLASVPIPDPEVQRSRRRELSHSPR